MLIMAAAYLARTDAGTATAYARAHAKIFTQWADYLLANALDPGFQNQTDDFTGFIGHSVNLALKGIVGIGARGQIAATAGDATAAAHYRSVSRDYITQWVTKAPGRLRGPPQARLRPARHLEPEVQRLPRPAAGTGDWCRRRSPTRRPRGTCPGPTPTAFRWDVRHTYTKADWEMWTAAWLVDHAEIRGLLIESLYEFATTTPSRGADDRLVRHGQRQADRLPGPAGGRRLLRPAHRLSREHRTAR